MIQELEHNTMDILHDALVVLIFQASFANALHRSGRYFAHHAWSYQQLCKFVLCVGNREIKRTCTHDSCEFEGAGLGIERRTDDKPLHGHIDQGKTQSYLIVSTRVVGSLRVHGNMCTDSRAQGEKFRSWMQHIES